MIGHINARAVPLALNPALYFDFDAAHPQDHPGPWRSTLKMHDSPAVVKNGKYEAVKDPKDRENSNKRIQKYESQHLADLCILVGMWVKKIRF